MEKRIFPAIFHKAEEGGYWVEFPDLPGCLTQGETIEQSFEMAQEALALWLDGAESVPAPTAMTNVVASGSDVVMLVEAGGADGIVYFKKSEVPKAIEAGLEKKGYTKYQVAQILGVDRGYITRISRGERVPAVDMAKRIGTLLDFDWRIFYSDGVAAY